MDTSRNQGSTESINSKTINVGGPDPIQGFDVGVFVQDMGRGSKDILLGQFTSIEILVKVATEPYKPIGSQIPIYLDGEMQVSFTMDKGLLDVNVFRETFGFKTYSWLNRYIRTPRLKITFAIDPVDFTALDEACQMFGQTITRTPSGRVVMEMCKIDEWGIGSRAGRQVVVTQWKGVSQQIYAEPLTLGNMPLDKQSGYDVLGKPTDPIEQPTFFYRDYADYASTSPRTVPGSYQLYPDWLTQTAILNAEKAVLAQLPDFPGKQALLDSIDRQIGATTSSANPTSTSTGAEIALFPERKSSAVNQFNGSLADLKVGLAIEKAAVQQLVTLGNIDPLIGQALLASFDTTLASLVPRPSGNTGEVRPNPDKNTSHATNQDNINPIGLNDFSFTTRSSTGSDVPAPVKDPTSKATNQDNINPIGLNDFSFTPRSGPETPDVIPVKKEKTSSFKPFTVGPVDPKSSSK